MNAGWLVCEFGLVAWMVKGLIPDDGGGRGKVRKFQTPRTKRDRECRSFHTTRPSKS